MSDKSLQLLGGISAAEFLCNYWQKKPCLIRAAIPGFSSFISKAELLQLALDPRVESRIVLERDGEYPWQVIHGPATEQLYADLPASHWTLLVQGVNLHHAGAAALLHSFSFIPNWRIDDVMISYAADQGSVGPHLDSYDVFLLQASGKRQWCISTHNYSAEDYLAEADLGIIGEFEPQQQWQLVAGDMLYLPPGVAHHGIARGECMTCSIGFRAPTQHELISGFLEDRYDSAGDNQYSDPGLEPARYPGEIHRNDLDRIRAMMQAPLADARSIETWFGRYITALPEQFSAETAPAPVSGTGLDEAISQGARLLLHHASRAAFIQDQEEIQLFVNGCAYRLPLRCRDVANKISSYQPIERLDLGADVPSECIQVLHDLYNKGILVSH